MHAYEEYVGGFMKASFGVSDMTYTDDDDDGVERRRNKGECEGAR